MKAPNDTAVLVLQDGTTLRGRAYGAHGAAGGAAAVFAGMIGFQAKLTDPQSAGAILIMTSPHLGTRGVEPTAPIRAAGLVLRDPARRLTTWGNEQPLEDALVQQGIVGIADVDTRLLTRHLRERHDVRAGIFSGDDLYDSAGHERTTEELVTMVRRGEQENR
jgi:carbamoyl-phosphate synthase small subunit